MTPGKYKDRIKIVDKIENDDEMGGGDVTYSEVIKLWANVTPISTNQQLLYSQSHTSNGYNIECRSSKVHKLTEKHGIIYKDKMLNIHSIDDSDSMKLKIVAFA